MDTDAFGRCLYAWSAQMLTGVEGPLQPVSVDGKVLRGTAQSGAKKAASASSARGHQRIHWYWAKKK